MPIDVRIHDNTNNVRVKPSTNDEVKVKSDCSTSTSRLESLIKQEKEERIEADENLQIQIIEKEDKIKYIELFYPIGTLNNRVLNLLISNRLNRIIYQDNYYMLSTKDNRYWRYMGQTTDPNIINTIVVDTVTGEYCYSSIGNAVLQDHISDEERHIRTGERNFWNNKLNFTTDNEVLEFNRN